MLRYKGLEVVDYQFVLKCLAYGILRIVQNSVNKINTRGCMYDQTFADADRSCQRRI